MTKIDTGFDDLFILELLSFKDDRGEFVKTIHQPTYQAAGLEHHFAESFYSVSNKNVLRGMHFQLPPHDHIKLVYVIAGSILDVVVDLRHRSSTFEQYFQVELSQNNRKAMYIGKGFAHGFLALEENTVVEYHTSTCQSKEHEGGILWNSFGLPWPGTAPILSLRDQHFPTLQQFISPF